jgi:predicted SAM-dependent methyltransferase
MKFLEIGPGERPQLDKLYPPEKYKGAEYIYVDANPDVEATYHVDAFHLPEELEGQIDGILASHVLEHFPYWQTTNVLRSWAKALKPGGEIHIVVPSLEWAAKEILADQPSKAVLPHLYAGQTSPWDVHLTGFTIRMLRNLLELAGFKVTRARSNSYRIKIGDEIMEAEQHYCLGVKPKKVEERQEF